MLRRYVTQTLLTGCAALACLTLPSAPAEAQQVAQATSVSGLEEIIVTARRREENIQAVPIAIQALSPEMIRERKVTDIFELGKNVPSYNARSGAMKGPNTGSANFGGTKLSTIRGLPGVVSYFSEAPDESFSYGRFMDLQNVQVASGPQGTLFGQNAIGGAILFYPKKPSDKIEGYIDGDISFPNDHRILEGALNVPVIADKVMVRVAGRREVQDGAVEIVSTGDRIDNVDTWAWRAGITFKPTEDIENYFVYSGSWTSQRQQAYLIQGINPLFQTNLANLFRSIGRLPASGVGSYTISEIDAIVAQQQALGPRKLQGPLNVNDNVREHRHFFVDVLTWQLNEQMLLKNVASLRRQNGGFRYDPDGTYLKMYTPGAPEGEVLSANQPKTWGRTYTEELQLQGSGMLDGKLDWTVGAFYLWTEQENPRVLNNGGCSYTFSLTSCTGPESSDNHNRNQSLFGQATYNLGGVSDSLEGLKLTAGVRHNWDMQSTWNQRYTTAARTACSDVLADSSCTRQLHGDWKKLSYTVGLDYQVTPDAMVYVTHRTGFNTGGFNAQIFDPARQQFAPELSNDIELGVKADWEIAGVKGRSNVAVFNTIFKNVQRAVAATFTDAGGAIRIQGGTFNAAKARVRGAEFNLNLSPVDPLNIYFNGNYLDSKYLVYRTLENPPVDLSNRAVDGTPRWTWSVGFRYDLPMEREMGRMTFAWNTSFRGRNYIDSAIGSPFEYADGYMLSDIRLDWREIAGYPIDAGVYVKNVMGDDYMFGAYNPYGANSLYFASYTPGDPRTYGISIRYRFGE